jgi:formiminotetrahydrofolate cyclodeaminase
MKSLSSLTVEEFLLRTGDRSPAPGGGAVTGLAGALACAQARMVVAYSISAKTDEPTRVALTTLAERLQMGERLFRELITEDADAYLAMTDAARIAKAKDAPADAVQVHQSAVMVAVSIPVQMAAIAADLLRVLDEHKTRFSRHMISDLGIAAALGEAAVRSAGYTLRANLHEVLDAQTRSRLANDMRTIASRAASGQASIDAFVQNALPD